MAEGELKMNDGEQMQFENELVRNAFLKDVSSILNRSLATEDRAAYEKICRVAESTDSSRDALIQYSELVALEFPNLANVDLAFKIARIALQDGWAQLNPISDELLPHLYSGADRGYSKRQGKKRATAVQVDTSWRKSYKQYSLRDLAKATGISKSKLGEDSKKYKTELFNGLPIHRVFQEKSYWLVEWVKSNDGPIREP